MTKRHSLEFALFACSLLLSTSATAAPLSAALENAPGVEKITLPEELVGASKSGEFAVIIHLNQSSQSVDWTKADSKNAFLQQNGKTQSDFLKSVPTIQPKHQFKTFPGISALVNEQQLIELLADSRVQFVEPVIDVELHDFQADALIQATSPKLSWNGSGVSIAIIDSGVDYLHPQLGNGAFPNAKVVSGTDEANLDADPIPAGDSSILNSKPSPHGTHCAGISAGNVFASGDYDGGIAPGAKISAVKVFPDGTPGTGTEQVTRGIEWCVLNQNIVPEAPILVMNLSLGGGKFTNTCASSFPSYNAAISSAIAAGISVVVSSGNDGYCDSISAPACIPGAIAVGAAYDANIGTTNFSVSSASCYPARTGNSVSETSAARKVTSYSNTSPLVAIVAPSHNAATLDIAGTAGENTGNFIQTFGGTSAAAPYVSGTIALMQQASFANQGRYLTPAEVRTLLTSTGSTVTDTKGGGLEPGVRIPFLNVAATMNAVTSGVDEAIELPNVGFNLGGDSPWIVDDQTFFFGDSSAVAGTIQNGQQTWFELIAPEATQITFNTKISSEPGGDFFTVSINGEQELSLSGERDWEEYSFPVVLGDVIRFAYTKNASTSVANDTAWVDHVRYQIAVPILPFNPVPPDQATGVDFEATLTWNNETIAEGVTHDFYFGTNPQSLTRFGTNLITPSYQPFLSDGVTYYWQIVSTNRLGPKIGPVWSFTTASNIPPSAPVLKPVLAAELAAPGVDPEGETVFYTGRWESSGPDTPLDFQSTTNQTLFTLQESPGRTFTVGETWTLTLTSQDSFGEPGGSATATFIIGPQSVRFEGWTFQ